jgi:hypothetical protein
MIILTCEGGGGLEDIVIRDERTGQVTELRLPPQLILMANHQVRNLAVELSMVSYLALGIRRLVVYVDPHILHARPRPRSYHPQKVAQVATYRRMGQCLPCTSSC